MDTKVNNIKNIIYFKKNNFPNISNIWLKYIEEQIKTLNKTLNDAEKLFKNLNKDIPQESIVMLYLLNSQINYI